MKKLLFVGALALTLSGLVPAVIAPAQAFEGDNYASSQQANINLNRIKSVLRLSSEQQNYWPPVEAALSDIAREQARTQVSTGYFSRIKNGIIGITMNSAALAKLGQAARPLLASLDDRQKQAARNLAREMGLGAMVAALN
ncbi:MAG: hypothetical protein JOZ70_13560 [Pseudolabrys sp.]|nr:hypothetical protein [Pseudolabrys sp.]MBV9956264.1 hypothetical protein [Pseudolabrys sp.]